MTSVHQEYAAALFAIRQESGQPLEEGLALVAEVFAKEPAYTELLACPAIPLEQRSEAIRQALGDAVPGPVLAFVQLLCRRGHIRQLPTCIEAYKTLEQAARQRTAARVISAVALTEDEKTRLQKALEQRSGRAVTVEWEQDPALLGGVIVHMDGKVLDGSLRRRLRDMKEGISQ